MLFGYMQVNRGRLDVFVAQQYLNGSKVSTGFQQMRSITVAQGLPVLLMICIPRKSAIAITRAME
jgi:hypothetical protein